MRVLVHVYNVSGYLMAELAALQKVGAEVAVLYTPWNEEYQEARYPTIKWVRRTDVQSVSEVLAALGAFRPDVFLCGGWSDSLALDLAGKLKAMGVTTVMAIDTPWRGTFRQWVNCLLGRFVLLPKFNAAWAAGPSQVKYLRKLGFAPSRIQVGFYSADTDKFNDVWCRRQGLPKVPHVFIYVGRYAPEKNMRRMERAFLAAAAELPQCDWRLRCIGFGELWDQRTLDPRIEHLGRKFPEEIQDFVAESGAFVLASLFEPWGVVVHEFALVGLPMICSSRVQATTAYLKDGQNGYLFDPEDEASMKNAFSKIMSASDETLRQMGAVSHELGAAYTTDDWAQRLLKFRK